VDVQHGRLTACGAACCNNSQSEWTVHREKEGEDQNSYVYEGKLCCTRPVLEAMREEGKKPAMFSNWGGKEKLQLKKARGRRYRGKQS